MPYREIQKQRATLRGIGKLVTAMKSIALQQCRELEKVLHHQALAREVHRQCMDDYLRDYPETEHIHTDHARLVCIVGTQRGFCGDINRQLALAALSPLQGKPKPPAFLLVGEELSREWGSAPPFAAIQGANRCADIASVMHQVLHHCQRLTLIQGHKLPAVTLMYATEGGLTTENVLDTKSTQAPPDMRVASNTTAMVLRYAPPAQFLRQLLLQHLHIEITLAISRALHHENKSRALLMEQAHQRISQRQDSLAMRARHERQTQITQAIEITLTSAKARASAPP